MFEIVKVKLIQCAFKVKKKYLDVSRLQPLYHQRMIELKTKGNKILTKNKIDHSTVFSTFDMDKLRKSVDTTGKSALILGKLPSLKVIRLKRAKRELHKASKIYKRLYRGGVGGHLHHTNVLEELYLRYSLVSVNRFQTWQLY